MLVSLFSVFDPVSHFYINFNWLMFVVVWVFCMLSFSYYFNNGLSVCAILLIKKVGHTFKDMVGVYNLGLVCMSVVLFCVFFIMNTFSLFPFIFTLTAHPMVSVGCGLTMWLSFILLGWSTNLNNMAAHLVPCGCPLMLAPFMVLIESISIMIRPFTLSIRLAANMMAGHLIIGLLSSISQVTISSFFLSLLFQNVMMILELGVAVIQSFVFSALIMLYVVESY